jgi:hypothetical protein
LKSWASSRKHDWRSNKRALSQRFGRESEAGHRRKKQTIGETHFHELMHTATQLCLW